MMRDRSERRQRIERSERGSSVLEMMCVLLLLAIVLATTFQAIVSVEKATSGTGARLQNLDPGAEPPANAPAGPGLEGLQPFGSGNPFRIRAYRNAARTVETLTAALDTAAGTVTAADAAGWFEHCGYEPWD